MSMKNWERKNRFATGYLNSCQDGVNVSVFSKNMLKRNNTSLNEWSTFNVVISFSFSFYDIWNLNYWTSFVPCIISWRRRKCRYCRASCMFLIITKGTGFGAVIWRIACTKLCENMPAKNLSLEMCVCALKCTAWRPQRLTFPLGVENGL